MKTQMRFQKILTLVSLIIAAFSVVYSLIFCSGIMNQVSAIYKDYDLAKYEGTTNGRASGATDLFNASQAFSDLFLVLGVIFVLAIVLLYITACQKRRKYYITNYIAIGIVVIYGLVYAILLLANVINIQAIYNNVNLVACQYYYEKYAKGSMGDWNASTWMLTLGYVFFAIVVADIALIVLNLVWKIKLMQGEKALLASGLVKEVA